MSQRPAVFTAGSTIARLDRGGVRSWRDTRVPGWTMEFVAGALLAVAFLLAVSVGGWLVLPIGLVAIGAAVFFPVAGLTTLVATVGFHQPTIGPLAFATLLAAAVAFGAIVRLAADRAPIRVHPAYALLIGYLAYSAASLPTILTGYPVAWATSATGEFIGVATSVLVVTGATMMFRRVPSEPFLWLTVGAAAFAAALAVAQFARIAVPTLVAGLLPTSGDLRAHGVFYNSNNFGFFAAQALILAIGMLTLARRERMVPAIACIAIIALGLALSYSRSSYIAAGVGVVVLVAARSRRLAVALVIAAVGIGLVVYPLFIDARLSVGAVSLTGNGEQDLLGGERARAVAIQAGLDLWRSQPLFGVGFGAFQFLSPQFGATVATYSHNQWLSILAEQGIVGLAMILGIVLLTGATLWRSTHPLRATALAMLVAYMVGSLFINSGPDPQISSLTWIVLGAVFAGGSRIGGVSISPRRYAA